MSAQNRPLRHRNSLPDDIDFALPTPRVVRCLGPGREHTFRSPDPAHRRLCARCTLAVERVGAAEYRATEVRE